MGGNLRPMMTIINDRNSASENGLEALVMENGMKRRKTIYEDVKPFDS